MRKLVYFILVNIIYSGISFCQDFKYEIGNKKVVIGRDLKENVDIEAVQYTFPLNVYEFDIDSVRNEVLMVIRKMGELRYRRKGYLINLDLKNENPLWTKKIRYYYFLSYSDNHIVYPKSNKSYYLDRRSGDMLWFSYSMIKHIDTRRNIGLFGSLKAADMNTGNVVWERNIDDQFGWDDHLYYNDTTFVIAASGIHTFNLKDGTGWDHYLRTGKDDYTKTLAMNTVGLGLALLTGTGYIYTGYDSYHGFASNLLMDNDWIYFVSKDNFVCIDIAGELIWEKTYEKNYTSASEIFFIDENVIMINKGFAYNNNYMVKRGVSFIAAYNRKNGEQEYFNTIKKNRIIYDYILKQDTLVILTGDGIFNYSISSGSLIKEISADMSKTGFLKYFPEPDLIYILDKDSCFRILTRTDITKYYVATDDEKIVVFDESFEDIRKFTQDEIYLRYLSSGDYNFIARKNKTYILDRNNNVVAELNASGNSVLVGTKLFCVDKKNFNVINLTGIID